MHAFLHSRLDGIKILYLYFNINRLAMRGFRLIRKLGHEISTTLSTKRFDTKCRRFHLLMVTINRENWRSSWGSRMSERFFQWLSHLLAMRFESQLSPLTHLSRRFHFRFERMQKALGNTARSRDFPYCSFIFPPKVLYTRFTTQLTIDATGWICLQLTLPFPCDLWGWFLLFTSTSIQ